MPEIKKKPRIPWLTKEEQTIQRAEIKAAKLKSAKKQE